MTEAGVPAGLVRRQFRWARHRLKPFLFNYWTVFLCERVFPRTKALFLHLGCGERRLADAVNIDARNTMAVDVVCDITRLPYKAGSVQRIETYHVLEHLPHDRAVAALRHWHALLRPGGRLIIECPDFDRAFSEYLSGNQERLGNIFGLQRFAGDFHLWGWNARRLGALLAEIGFKQLEEVLPQDYHAASEPCLRLEAAKDDGT